MEKSKLPEILTGVEDYSLEATEIQIIENLELKKLKADKLASFSWPLELQGKGETNEKDKSLLVRFPKGDIFLSLITTIHELGHLRQKELNPGLKSEVRTHELLLAEERDAWERGWQRMLGGNPDFLKGIEEKFADYKSKGKLESQESFASLYEWIKNNLLKAVEVQSVLFEGLPDTAAQDTLADALEKIDFRNFLEEYARNRVGEEANETEMREFIKSILVSVVKE